MRTGTRFDGTAGTCGTVPQRGTTPNHSVGPNPHAHTGPKHAAGSKGPTRPQPHHAHSFGNPAHESGHGEGDEQARKRQPRRLPLRSLHHRNDTPPLHFDTQPPGKVTREHFRRLPNSVQFNPVGSSIRPINRHCPEATTHRQTDANTLGPRTLATPRPGTHPPSADASPTVTGRIVRNRTIFNRVDCQRPLPQSANHNLSSPLENRVGERGPTPNRAGLTPTGRLLHRLPKTNRSDDEPRASNARPSPSSQPTAPPQEPAVQRLANHTRLADQFAPERIWLFGQPNSFGSQTLRKPAKGKPEEARGPAMRDQVGVASAIKPTTRGMLRHELRLEGKQPDARFLPISSAVSIVTPLLFSTNL
jgi:hypothetical protein